MTGEALFWGLHENILTQQKLSITVIISSMLKNECILISTCICDFIIDWINGEKRDKIKFKSRICRTLSISGSLGFCLIQFENHWHRRPMGGNLLVHRLRKLRGLQLFSTEIPHLYHKIQKMIWVTILWILLRIVYYRYHSLYTVGCFVLAH